MATVTKNFKIKHGLVVEGTTGTINNFDILTKSTDDQQYIVDLVGGDAASNATANTGAGGNGGKTNATTALAGGNGGSGLVVLRYVV